jgi:hypothetical protein
MRPPLLGDQFEGAVQIGGLLGQHRDDLVAIAIGGGPRHPEPHGRFKIM